MSTAVGHKRLKEVLEETGGRKQAAKSPTSSSMLAMATTTKAVGEILTLVSTMANERKFHEESWEKQMELKRLEVKEKLELKKLEAAKKRAS